MYVRICSLVVLFLSGLALSECATPYACPPGYHPGPYGRRCFPNAAYYPPPPGYAQPSAGYGPAPGYSAPPPGGPSGYAAPPGSGPPPSPPPGYSLPPGAETVPPPGSR